MVAGAVLTCEGQMADKAVVFCLVQPVIYSGGAWFFNPGSAPGQKSPEFWFVGSGMPACCTGGSHCMVKVSGTTELSWPLQVDARGSLNTLTDCAAGTCCLVQLTTLALAVHPRHLAQKQRCRRSNSIQFDIKGRMFDVSVEPVLCDASQIWGPMAVKMHLWREAYDIKAEKVQTSFLRPTS